ncbi:MAG: sigma-70 family RNA polymerase sigma factor [Oscillatoria sp. SIO1A7]|nr:sigma-70 family RNA polymerase sigma factor [Oscillatoria sp. SIO1A7]
MRIRWKIYPHLKRNLELYANRHEDYAALCRQSGAEERFTALWRAEERLVQFWMGMALNGEPPQQTWEPRQRRELAWQHLMAYAETSCYHAAKKIWDKDRDASWEEYLNYAQNLIYEVSKLKSILLDYDSSQSSLDTYLEIVLNNRIKNEAKASLFSRWRLLCVKSKKELEEALARASHREPEISRFVFARKYFVEVYEMNKRQDSNQRKKMRGSRVAEPDRQDFEEAARLYNTKRLHTSSPHEVVVGSDITGVELQDWMELCIAALQNYPKSAKPRLSIEESGYNLVDENWEDWGVREADGSEESGELAQAAEKALREQVLALKTDQQEMLILYYGVGLNQKELAARIGIGQAAISRRLNTVKSKFIQALAGLSKPAERVPQYVKPWLQRHYRAPDRSDLMEAALVEAHKNLDEQKQEVLRLRYGQQQLEPKTIASQLGISEQELELRLSKAEYQLEQALLKTIQRWTTEYLQLWLANFSKSLVKSACEHLKISWVAGEEPEKLDKVLQQCLTFLQ